jgi:hypothetical protein
MDSKKILAHHSCQSSKCPVFGYPKELPQNVLSTCGDVMKCFLNEKLKIILQNDSTEPTVSEISEIVASSWKLFGSLLQFQQCVTQELYK